jgi:hypothetical protein
MRIERGRPVIESDDHPVTVNRALHVGASLGNEDRTSDEQFRHGKVFADAWGTLQDHFGIVDLGDEVLVFRPDGEALLYMTPDQLELAVVVHGLQSIAQGADEEVARVDHILRAIDSARAAVPAAQP